ncbi:Hypothetical protein NTJ_07819 [Nesidiocoris tenuis]|uniref:Uncharacterized protein n=1 Tax=Nesidiocoris tenuis TaxID=355587 RepID=A0ABN7AUM0_9HEMI|nr:Hypothetical protein NTJ_07819 [Nesidiocoris tenuis]
MTSHYRYLLHDASTLNKGIYLMYLGYKNYILRPVMGIINVVTVLTAACYRPPRNSRGEDLAAAFTAYLNSLALTPCGGASSLFKAND